MPVRGPVETWLKRLVLLAMTVLLCMLTFFVWRLSVLVQKLDQTVGALSSDVGNVARKASEITGTLLDPRRVVEELTAEEEFSDNPVAEKEIRYLMDCIGQPDLNYEYGDDRRSAAWVQAKFWIKYRAFRNGIISAEDFIRKVASETHDNEVYYLIDKNGNKTELSLFLTQALNKYRSPDTGEASAYLQ